MFLRDTSGRAILFFIFFLILFQYLRVECKINYHKSRSGHLELLGKMVPLQMLVKSLKSARPATNSFFVPKPFNFVGDNPFITFS